MKDYGKERHLIREYYQWRSTNAMLAGWFIRELLTPSRECLACGMFWYERCTH